MNSFPSIKSEKDINYIYKKLYKNHLEDKVDIYSISSDDDKSINDSFTAIIGQLVRTDIKNIAVYIENIVKIYFDYDIPYMTLINEVNFIQKELIRLEINNKNNKNVLQLLKHFDNIEEIIANNFLTLYLKVLKEQNNMRLDSLTMMLEDKMISYYESHIRWVNDLADALLDSDHTKIPETNHHKCDFGQWLDSEEAQNVIVNPENFLELYGIHKRLHTLAHKVSSVLTGDTHEYLDCYVYIQKAENISKEIGSKLSFFSNQLTIENATKDPLTNLLNRSLMAKLFEKEYELHTTTGESFVMAMCDLDRFKAINDNYGHLAGDEVLKFFANLMISTFRNSDILIRYGGEEFIIILPATKLSSSLILFENLRKSLQKSTIMYNEIPMSITVSIGLMEINPKMENKNNNLQSYVSKVDELLYEAKENGRNRIEVQIF